MMSHKYFYFYKCMRKNIGYIAIEFNENSKRDVINWSAQIRKDELVETIVNGQVEGGNVTKKLHSTLFYGLNESILDKVKLANFVEKLNVTTVNVVGVGMFPLKAFNCNVLYLEISDKSKILKSAHKHLRKFPHFREYQKYDYSPHITIAYVSKKFDAASLTRNFPPKLSVKTIKYIRAMDKM